ncbi:MAG TPA: isoprenylcysteine carboxylmethyltransferase family protein [Acidimicrobiales bacterium]|nr:isoprenylcysteine carboxylmethyltransferase family protein [Acidimicrobiales bacterium]
MSKMRARASQHKWLLAAYAGLGGFFALEALFRQSGGASSLKGSEDDRGTTRSIVLAYGLASGLPLLARRLPLRPLPPAAAPTGLALQAAGLAVRAWSMQALGSSYTRTLRVDGSGQQLVEHGPYRRARHPGYLGSLMTWTGFALASRSKASVVLIPGLLGVAYRRRITAEEQLLRRDLPGYAAYCQRTKRLVPFVW